jgi:hypothetical protein
MKTAIIKIKAKHNVVLSHRGGVTGWGTFPKDQPIDPESPIWEQRIDGGSEPGLMHPAAFLIKKSTRAALEITLQIPRLDTKTGYILEGLLGNIVLFSGSVTRSNTGTGEVVFEVNAQYQFEGFFRITGEALSWQVRQRDSKEVIPLRSVNIELYWLYNRDYDFFNRGIPVEILRQLADICRFTGTPQDYQLEKERIIRLNPGIPGISAAEWLIESIVKYCFSSNPPHYDIYEGKQHFMISGTPPGGMTFRRNKYQASRHDSMSRCNCDDQAALLQFYFKAIGFPNVSYCSLSGPGYLRLTRVVGRDFCNNPFYNKEGEEWKPVVDERDPVRKSFRRHAFCYLGDYRRIADSCYGPYTGDEEASQYLNHLLDNKTPHGKQESRITSMEIRRYPGVTQVDWINGIIHMPKWPSVEQLKEEIQFSEEKNKHLLEKVVIRDWRSPTQCPALQDGWETIFEEIIPGKGEVLKTWRLKKEKQRIDVDLYVASGGNQLAINRFLTFDLFRTNPDVSIEKTALAEFISPYLVKSTGRRHSEWFWPAYNLAFNVTFQDVPSKVQEALVIWLNGETASGKSQESLKDELNLLRLDAIDDSTKIVKKGKPVNIILPDQPDVLCDFHLSGNGLVLVAETDKELCFRALSESNNRLVIAAVHKKTLLVRNKEIKIIVPNEED